MNSMHLASLDLNLLVAFEQLLAGSSVTRAAKALGVTQPAMSRTLGRLRDTFDDPLFVRDGRALTPTPRAKELSPKIDEALRAARAVFERPEPFDPKTARGEARIALGNETQSAFADAILTDLWREAPGIDVRIRQLTAESPREAKVGAIDLALAPDLSALPGSTGAVDLSDYVQKRVYDRRFVVVSSPDHPRRRLSLEAYAAADHIVAGPEASGRGFVDELLEERGLTRRVAASVSSFSSAAEVAARTSLISTLPDDVVRTSRPDLVVAKPPIPLPVLPMLLVWHPRHTTDPRHRFVRERVERAIRGRVAGPKAARR